jgi:Flp pilus assembly protein TadD
MGASGCRSTPRIASTARRATSRTRRRTSTGWSQKAAEGRIIRTCKRLLAAAIAAGLAASPAWAEPADLGAYLQARSAAHAGADEQASRRFAALLRSAPNSLTVAQRALEHGISAGDWPLALRAARRLDQAGALPPTRRILLVGEALRTRDWAAAALEIDKLERGQAFAQTAPVLRAWRSFGMREADPLAPLAAIAEGPMAGYAVEHRALIELALGRGDATQFLSLEPGSGLRPQHLRLLAAAELAARGSREQALALTPDTHPALAAARAQIVAGRPLAHRIDTAAEGAAELLSRVAVDLGQQQQVAEGVILARIASYLAPDAAQPLMIAAELVARNDPAAAARLLARVKPTDPFAGAARELRLGHLAKSGQTSAALTEVTARTRRGSQDPADWIQLGTLHIDARRFADAAQAFTRAHELWRAGTYPAISEWSLWLMRASALDQGGDWPAARAALQEAYRLAPGEAAVLNYLGYAQLDRGENLQESERLIREAVRLAPNDAAIIDSLGWATFKRGRIAEAIPLLERAVKAEPGDPEINEHLGDAYYAAGRRIEARFAWSAALLQAEGEAATRIRGKIDRGAAPQIATR